jgi:hypothetical protein
MEVANDGASKSDEFYIGKVKAGGTMTTLLFTISISATYRGTQEIYSAQVIARNGENLYHLAEALSISEALEKVVEEMRLQEKKSASLR